MTVKRSAGASPSLASGLEPQAWRSFADALPALVDFKSPDGRIIWVNRAFAEFHRGSPDEFVGKTLTDIYGTHSGGGLVDRDQETARTLEPVGIEYMVNTPAGVRTIQRMAYPVLDEQGALAALGGIGLDISERKATELSLARDSRYASLFNQAPIAIWEEDWSDAKRIIDGLRHRNVDDIPRHLQINQDLVWRLAWECSIVDFNQHAVSMFKAASREALWSRAVSDFSTEGEYESFLSMLMAFARGRTRCITNTWQQTEAGEDIYVRSTAFIPEGYEQSWQRILITNEDITESHRLAAKLRHEASHDSLTGLVNRREFEVRLQRVVESAREEHGEHALCYLDLDQFKVINDRCGHIAGDDLLRRLARLFSSKVRKRDTLARLGGDEFALLVEHCPFDQAERVAESLRQSVEAFSFTWEGASYKVGVSIGLVRIDAETSSMIDVMSAADAACYAAKDAGRNRIQVHDPEARVFLERRGEMRWASRIRRALENDGFELFAQPIVPLHGAMTPGDHFEILLRMPDETDVNALPGGVIRASERFDLAGQIDRWVVNTALAWLEARPAVVERLGGISINVFGRSLDDEAFIDFLRSRLDQTSVPARKLCFEITETTLIGDLQRAAGFMREIRGRGCRFSLDDFGTGVSSFSYLAHLPVEFVKIDATFVRQIEAHPMNLAVVRSINDVARTIGARTVGEGVHSARLRELLLELGVDYAQGNILGEPRPLGDWLE